MEKKERYNYRVRIGYVMAVFVTFIHNCSFSLWPQSSFNDFVCDFLMNVLPKCAVPIFYMMSAVLLFRGEYNLEVYKKKMRRRIGSLVVPYLLWNTIGLLFTLFRTELLSRIMTINYSFDVSFTSIIRAIILHTEMPPMWFMEHLIIYSLASPIIYCLAKNKWTAVGTLMTWLVLISLVKMPHRMPMSFFMYFLGAVIGIHFFDWFMEKNEEKKNLILSVAIITCFFVYGLLHLDKTKIPECMDIVFIAVYSLASWNILKLLFCGEPKSFERNSIMLYFMHPIVLPIISNCLVRILPSGAWFSIFAFVICNVVLYIVVEICCRVLKKISPVFFGVLSGGR